MDPTTNLKIVEKALQIINDRYGSQDYTQIRQLNGNSLHISKCQINLKRELKPEKPDSKNADTNNIYRELDPDSIHNLKAYFSTKNCTKTLILGRPGIGKTSFCKKLIHLHENSGELKNADVKNTQILHIPLRNLNLPRYSNASRHPVVKLKNVLYYEYFSQEEDGSKLAKCLVDSLKEDGRCYIFLLDGLDEVPQIIADKGHPVHDFLLDLFSPSKAYNIIITSRPSLTSLVEGKFSFDGIAEIVGFDCSNVANYLAHCYPNNNRVRDEVLKLVKNSPILHSLISVPIQLDILCLCVDEDSELFRVSVEHKNKAVSLTMTTLYTLMINCLWRQTLEKNGTTSSKNISLAQINDRFKEEINFLSLLAFEQLIKNPKPFFTVNDLPPGSNNEGLISTILNSFILQSQNTFQDDENAPITISYSFVQQTFQEYFAALHIANNFKDLYNNVKIASFIRVNKYNPRFKVVWRFVAGLLASYAKNDGNGKIISNFYDILEQAPRDLLSGVEHQALIIGCLVETQWFSKKEEFEENFENSSKKPNSRWDRLSEEFLLYLKHDEDFCSGIFFRSLLPQFPSFPEKILEKLVNILVQNSENFESS